MKLVLALNDIFVFVNSESSLLNSAVVGTGCKDLNDPYYFNSEQIKYEIILKK